MGNHTPSGTAEGIDGAEHHRVVVQNHLSELRRVSEWVRRRAFGRGLTRERVHALELSVYEALTNIISYAYADEAPHEIVVEMIAQPDRIHVELVDDGVPFDPLGLQIEELPKSLEESRASGRGIPLMRKFMDELHYERSDNRNVLTMVMRNVKV